MNPIPESEVTRDPDALLHSAEEVANHPLVRSKITLVYAVKAAAKGTPDNPFTGRMTTARKFNSWILNHPEFVPYKWLRKMKMKSGADQGAANTDKLAA